MARRHSLLRWSSIAYFLVTAPSAFARSPSDVAPDESPNAAASDESTNATAPPNPAPPTPAPPTPAPPVTESAPGLAEVEPVYRAEPESFGHVTSPAADSGDPDAIFRAYAEFARVEKKKRILEGIGGMVLGGTTMALGTVIAEQTSTSPDPWLILGGVSIGAGLLSLVFTSPAEALGAEHRVDVAGHDREEADRLERSWRRAADEARGGRIVGSVVTFVFAAAGIGGGSAILAGAGDFTESDRNVWGSILVGSGAGFGLAGITGLVLPSPMEASYAQYAATKKPAASVELGLRGLGVGLSGHF